MGRVCHGLCSRLAERFTNKYGNKLREKVRLDIGEKKCRHCNCVYPASINTHCKCCGCKLATRLLGNVGRKKRIEKLVRY